MITLLTPQPTTHQTPIHMIQEAAVTHHLPPPAPATSKSEPSLKCELAFAKNRIRTLQEALDHYQREVHRATNKKLDEQLEINQMLVEYVIQLEDELNAIKQRNN